MSSYVYVYLNGIFAICIAFLTCTTIEWATFNSKRKGVGDGVMRVYKTIWNVHKFVSDSSIFITYTYISEFACCKLNFITISLQQGRVIGKSKVHFLMVQIYKYSALLLFHLILISNKMIISWDIWYYYLSSFAWEVRVPLSGFPFIKLLLNLELLIFSTSCAAFARSV